MKQRQGHAKTLGLWWKARPLHSQDAGARVKAVGRLAKTGASQAVAPLLEALEDRDEEVRLRAAEALGQSQATRAIAPLVELLLHETDSEVCEAVTGALQSLDSERAARLLFAALAGGDAAVRHSAATALRDICWNRLSDGERALVSITKQAWEEAAAFGAAAIEPLEVTLREGTQSAKRHAAEALASIPGAATPHTLKRLLNDRTADATTRTISAWALRRHFWNDLSASDGAAVSVAERKWDEAIEAGEAAERPLCEALAEGGPAVRVRAADALAQIGGNAATDALCDLVLHPGDNVALTEVAVRGLGLIGGERCLSALAAALRATGWKVRATAAVILRDGGWTPPTDEDRAWFVVARESWDEAVTLGPKAIPALLGALDYVSVSEAAAGALTRIGTEGVNALVELLSDDTRPIAVREVVTKTLVDRGDTRVIEPVVSLLEDPDMAVRQSAVWALEQLGWQPRSNPHRVAVAIAHDDWDKLVPLAQAAIDPLLALVREAMASKETISTLRKILDDAAERLSINQLRRIAGVEDPVAKTRNSWRDDHSDDEQDATIAEECDKLRKAAKFALFRRGILR